MFVMQYDAGKGWHSPRIEPYGPFSLDPAWYLRQRGEDEILPWDHIDCGSPKEFFLRERRRALAGSYTPDCRGGECSGCGVCDFEGLRMRLTAHA